MVTLYGYLWMDRPFFKRILLTALFERAHSSQNALISWLRTHKVRHQVKISACVNVHASIYCTSNRFCSTWLWNPSKAEEEVFSWKYCLHLFLYILSVPLPLPHPYLQVQLNLRKNFKRFKWYIWEIFGRSDGQLANQIGLNKPTNR